MIHRLHGCFLSVLILAGASACSGDLPGKARGSGERVQDGAGVLSIQEKKAISGLLEDYERETTHQLGVLTVKSLSGESI